MGKSPGRWIRAILFGKKSSKSNISKTKKKTESEEASVATIPPPGIPAENSPVASDPVIPSTDEIGENSELATSTDNFPNVGVNTKGPIGLGSISNTEIAQQQEAITKVQAAYRGYLARRAFRALKGIIRLQAVVRGHLVRRQAIVTLYCMRGIVKLQALIRGRSIRFSDAAIEMKKRNSSSISTLDSGVTISHLEKLSANAFVVKLLLLSTVPPPLHLQYDLTDPNSVPSWLNRWSLSRFWEPFIQPNIASEPKPQIKETSVEPEQQSRSKRSVRRASSANTDQSVLSTSENEKPKLRTRKPSILPSESVHENPQYELERVKRSLRKVSNPLPPDVPEQVTIDESEKPSEQSHKMEMPSNPLFVAKPIGGGVHGDDHPVLEIHKPDSGEKDDDAMMKMGQDCVSKEVQANKENQRARRRRSFPLKHENLENVPQNAPALPSYMAATQSAKAKARSQGSPRAVTQDDAENGFVRRHSLSSATNGKLSSPSPRLQRLSLSSGKGGSKMDNKPSSRESHEKAEWRR